MDQIQQQYFLERIFISFEHSLVKLCKILLEEHLQSCREDLRIVGLDTPNNVAVFVTHAPAKRARMICHLLKSTKAPISDSFTRTVTRHNH
jgi:hypothetical protein